MRPWKNKQWLWGLLVLLCGCALSVLEFGGILITILQLVGVVWLQTGLSRLSGFWWGLIPAGLWGGFGVWTIGEMLLYDYLRLQNEWPFLVWYLALFMIPAVVLLLIHRSVRGNGRQELPQIH